MVDRSQLARWLVGVGAAAALLGTFLPWLSSGSVGRSSYELFSIVDRLGFSSSGAIGWALRLWPLAPLVLVLSAVVQGIAADDPWRRGARFAIPAVAVLYVGGTALAVHLAPDGGLFRLRFGSSVTAIGAIVMVSGLILRPDREGSDDSIVSPAESGSSEAS